MKKKKKKRKNNNNGNQKKCNICLNQYISQNLDKHMHSRAHHDAIERLTGREQMHKCWACDVSVPGLEQFRKHIGTEAHNTKLVSLKQRTESGFAVDYNNDELNALCAQRDRHRSLLKLQKHKEKLKRLRERKAAKFQDAFTDERYGPHTGYGISQMKDTGQRTRAKGFGPHAAKSKWSDSKSVAYSLNNENKQGTMNTESVLQSISNEGVQPVAWNGFGWQTSKSITRSMKEDVDFRSDRLAQSEICTLWAEDESRQSRNTSRQQVKVTLDQKRSCGAHTSDSPPVKKQCLREGPSMKPGFPPSVCFEKLKSERVSQSASSAAPLRSPGLVQSHMDHLSRMLKNIRKSLEEERLRAGSSEHPDPKPGPVTDDRLKRNEQSKATAPSDVPRFSEKCARESSIKSQTCDMQAFKTKTRSSPCEQANSPPQENPEPTQPRHVLPTLLSRSVSKTEANKPNLKVARGIRTSQKPGHAAEARVLKPALQKLITSKSSQWRVNWKEIYQEAAHRKLQREKGMPRFGIELVTPLPPDPQGLEAEELAQLELDEGFQWASVECDAVTLPRSVNPSGKDACRFPPAEAYPAERRDHGKTAETTNRTSCPVEHEQGDVGENHSTSGMSRSSELTPLDRLVCVKTEKSDDYCTEPRQEKADHDRIPVTQIKHTTPDFPGADTLDKNPPKSQLNELLVMSLREDELCSSLQDVDSRLLRAQADLQTAFMKVQHLQMIKQQVAAEMSSLRSKRIDMLQGIKNSRVDQTSDADSPGSPVRTQRQDTAPDRSSFLREFHPDGDDERRPDLSLALVPVSESRKTH